MAERRQHRWRHLVISATGWRTAAGLLPSPQAEQGFSMSQILSIKSNKPIKTVNLTDTAVSKVGELIAAEGEDSLALRMAVRPGGCSGFSYEMFFDSEIESADIIEEFGDVRVVVDPQSAERLRGSTLDYRDGLMGAGFAIDNPNVTKSCGCGNSFS
jgi:iron-sulfur cluster assembly protein/iron-sulfur cluster insertion protein